MNILTAFIRLVWNNTRLSLLNTIIIKRQHLNIFCKNKLSQKKMIKTIFWHDEKNSWNKKLKREVNVMRLIELKKITWHVKHVKHKKSKNQKCMTLVSSMSSMTHIEHVKHDTLKMYFEVYKHIFYSAEKNLFIFLLSHFF